MTKSASKQPRKSRTPASRRQTAATAARKSSPKPPSRKRPPDGATKSRERSNTKQAQVIAMLRTPTGATIDAIMHATGWQQHSVRGFLAAVVRKRLGLDLQSEQGSRGRVYRVSGQTADSDNSSHAA